MSTLQGKLALRGLARDHSKVTMNPEFMSSTRESPNCGVEGSSGFQPREGFREAEKY